MFKKSSVVPQRKPFSLTRAQIIADIEAISSSEEERNKLYVCLDDKVPQERKYVEMAALLQGTQHLEDVQQKLKEQIEKLHLLSDGLSSSIDEIEGKVEACQ